MSRTVVTVSALEGRPDFAHQRRWAPDPSSGGAELPEGALFHGVFGRSGVALLVPESLALATEDDDRPALGLELVRGERPDRPPEPYGLLDVTLVPRPAAADLRPALEGEKNVLFEQAPFAGGFLRFAVLGETGDGSTEEPLGEPEPVAWSGGGPLAVTRRLDGTAVTRLEGALETGIVALLAEADLLLPGVADRLPGRLEVRPRQLLQSLGLEAVAAGAGEAAGLTREDLVSFLSGALERGDLSEQGLSELGLSVQGLEPASGTAATFASSVADQIVARWGRLLASAPGHSTSENLAPRLAFTAPEEAPDTDETWDLSVPAEGLRPVRLRLDPLAAARAWERLEAAAGAGGRPAVRRITVPALERGVRQLILDANLPGGLPATGAAGLLELGAHLHAPARPPSRFQAIRRTVVFDDGTGTVGADLSADLELAFGLDEEAAATLTPYAVFLGPDGVAEELEGAPVELDLAAPTTRHLLAPAAFPVAFAAVTASDRLLETARLELVAVVAATGDGHDDDRVLAGATLDAASGASAVTLAVPAERAGEARLRVVAVEERAEVASGAPRRLALEDRPFAATRLSLASLPGFGAHEITVRCRFPEAGADEPGPAVVAFDFLPGSPGDASDDAPGAVTTLSFTRERPERPWRWLAASPFDPGYRVRRHPEPGEDPEPWSDPHGPARDLELAAVPAPASTSLDSPSPEGDLP